MSIVQFDSQKIEQLLKSATSERQRKMYQALLDKARKQERSSTTNQAPETTPSTEKTAQTTTKGQTKTKKKTKTAKKNQKVATQSTTTEASTTTKQSSKTVTEASPLPSKPATLEPAPSAIDVAPQTSPKSKSKKKKKKKKKQTAVSAPIFQALGTVIATPYLKDELIKIVINGSEYDLLYVQGSRRQAYIRLKEELEKNGSSPMFLRLYPRVTFDYKTQQPRLAFSLVGFSRDCEKINDEPQGFVLRGIWQDISHYESPVISICRNRETKEVFKRLNKTQQFSFARPHHIPVVWDAPVEPFKFNPSAEKDSQMPRHFVQVRAIFKDGLFVVEEMLQEPTRKIPQYISVPKSSD